MRDTHKNLAKLLLLVTYIFSFLAVAKEVSPSQVGAAQLDQYLPQLKGKRVGMIVNQTSVVGNQHLVDLLLSHDIDIKTIFAPEHGFRGDQGAGELIASGVDSQTGIKITSIYGRNKRPSMEVMKTLDLVIFDIQDVGVRFYTYISSMHYMMQAAAESGVEFLVLDRPNPNIRFVDGPVLEAKFRSFVGMHPIPVLHGLTVAELAKMIVGEGWLKINANNPEQQSELKLKVVPVNNYYRTDSYSLPIAPSPNLPNDISIQLYPSLCFFEATPISIGRGTDFPFQVVGYEKSKVSNKLGSFEFTPRKIAHAAPSPKLEGKQLIGQDLRKSDIQGLQLATFISWYQQTSGLEGNFFQRADFMDKLAGTDQLRLAIEAGKSEQLIKSSWRANLQEFNRKRQQYLLYQ